MQRYEEVSELQNENKLFFIFFFLTRVSSTQSKEVF